MKAKGAGSNIYSSSVESSLLLFPPLDIIMLARHPADIISESESFSFFIDTPQHRREQDSAERTSINHFDHTIVSTTSSYSPQVFLFLSEREWQAAVWAGAGGWHPPKRFGFLTRKQDIGIDSWYESPPSISMGPPGGYALRGTY